MQTFFVQTLGCKVNQYESEQLAALLRARGLRPAASGREGDADLRIINTCSVTVQAAAKSRQLSRRAGRESSSAKAVVSLPQFTAHGHGVGGRSEAGSMKAVATGSDVETSYSSSLTSAGNPPSHKRSRVVVTGCWATSDREAAAAISGVDAVIGHHQDVASELIRLLDFWQEGGFTQIETAKPDAAKAADRLDAQATPRSSDSTKSSGLSSETTQSANRHAAPEPLWNEGWINKAGSPVGKATERITPFFDTEVNGKIQRSASRRVALPVSQAALPRPPKTIEGTPALRHDVSGRARGTTTLPLLSSRQTGRQRAHLKVQDGCDAHCTYCIIPRLRPGLWSKPVNDVVDEAKQLVAAGHVELVLTGIFLGAYGEPTALRRRRKSNPALAPLAQLAEALCTGVPGLRRLRFSSLEPGDLTGELVAVLRSHARVVPHFHLPLQSGSDELLRRMNRQYTRDEYLCMIDRVCSAFDRPALTTDIIAGFPGETPAEFERTLEVVEHSRFIHIHAFPFSPRPGTAAARWTSRWVPGPAVSQRIEMLRARSEAHSLAFRRQFVGQSVQLLVERENDDGPPGNPGACAGPRHGRCERYFDVQFEDPSTRPGDLVRVRVERVEGEKTLGTKVQGP